MSGRAVSTSPTDTAGTQIDSSPTSQTKPPPSQSPRCSAGTHWSTLTATSAAAPVRSRRRPQHGGQTLEQERLEPGDVDVHRDLGVWRREDAAAPHVDHGASPAQARARVHLDAVLERARYANCGYPVRGANLRSEKLALLRASGGAYSSLDEQAKSARAAIVAQWLNP